MPLSALEWESSSAIVLTGAPSVRSGSMGEVS